MEFISRKSVLSEIIDTYERTIATHGIYFEKGEEAKKFENIGDFIQLGISDLYDKGGHLDLELDDALCVKLYRIDHNVRIEFQDKKYLLGRDAVHECCEGIDASKLKYKEEITEKRWVRRLELYKEPSKKEPKKEPKPKKSDKKVDMGEEIEKIREKLKKI